jgi:hypothetical protein
MKAVAFRPERFAATWAASAVAPESTVRVRDARRAATDLLDDVAGRGHGEIEQTIRRARDAEFTVNLFGMVRQPPRAVL